MAVLLGRNFLRAESFARKGIHEIQGFKLFKCRFENMKTFATQKITHFLRENLLRLKRSVGKAKVVYLFSVLSMFKYNVICHFKGLFGNCFFSSQQ